MPRPAGSKNLGNNEFAIRYEELVHSTKLDPVEVLFKLCRSRTQSIKVQAASTLMKYRFPTMKAATLELEAAKQIVMTWEASAEIDPPALEHLQIPEILGDESPELVEPNGSEPDDRREFPRHQIEDDEIPL